MKSAKFAATILVNGPLYSPSFQLGSRLMESIIILRSIRLRPPISTGAEASGINASMKSGYIVPHIQVCMAPIEVPMTTRRWFTASFSVTSLYSACTISVYV